MKTSSVMRVLHSRVSLSVHPLPDVRRTVREADALRLAAHEAPNDRRVDESHLGQFERHVASTFGADEPPQLRQMLTVNPPNYGQRHECGLNDPLILSIDSRERDGHHESQSARRAYVLAVHGAAVFGDANRREITRGGPRAVTFTSW
jgi:hypothetical protein